MGILSLLFLCFKKIMILSSQTLIIITVPKPSVNCVFCYTVTDPTCRWITPCNYFYSFSQCLERNESHLVIMEGGL